MLISVRQLEATRKEMLKQGRILTSAWLCPLQPLNSFEELGEELAIKAIRDMDRPHYKKAGP